MISSATTVSSRLRRDVMFGFGCILKIIFKYRHTIMQASANACDAGHGTK